MMRVWLFLIVACSCAWAQELTPRELGEATPLPPAYGGKAVEMVDGGFAPTQFEFEFAIAEDWTVGTQYRVDPDFGRSPITYEHATMDLSYRYGFESTWTVSETSRFRDERMMSMEQLLSPLPLIRMLRSDRMDDVKWDIHQEGGMTILELHSPRSTAKQRLFFEPATHRLVRSQILSPAGDITAETRFENWTPIGEDYEVPMTVLGVLRLRGTEITQTTTLSDVRLMQRDAPPERKPIPQDATIVNHEAGVTTTADGTVLGKIERTPSPSGSAAQSDGRLSLNARTLMTAGVALILLAGAVLGWRRWKGA